MANYNYVTKDGSKDGYVVGHGLIVDGKISSDTPIECPTLKLEGDKTEDSPAFVDGTASQQNPEQPESVAETEQNNVGVQLG